MINVKLYFFDTNKYTFDDLKNSLYITDKDINNSLRYKMDINRKEALISSYFKNKYVNSEIYINEYDKPLSKDILFNISHSNGLVVLGISDKYDIGVDIEKIRDAKDNLIRYISDDEEYNYIKDEKSFYEIWTSKESIVKCLGKGLYKRVIEIPSLPINGIKSFDGNLYNSKIISNDEYVISVTLNTDEDFNVEFINEMKL